ncbi:hypothetical protein AZA_88878 [Nitrospirillum viridazoti Y2]|uniref:Uncharacterized protein n=1 Tax=Nitrospirillum amazonense TaxID=28077 RepID=A0A560HLC5_9PROT|nr:hypothetical protein [Nitrospirillum amazonense]EGY01206.1 hypothetical protein AZA_88878 [Nitrospirillum amazonense Y2]TWB47327.1 hypothetical protein FBZ92_13549 [Nitrospirillum amazonense]
MSFKLDGYDLGVLIGAALLIVFGILVAGIAYLLNAIGFDARANILIGLMSVMAIGSGIALVYGLHEYPDKRGRILGAAIIAWIPVFTLPLAIYLILGAFFW